MKTRHDTLHKDGSYYWAAFCAGDNSQRTLQRHNTLELPIQQ